MPSREPELYKDKIEVSLDGRQIFYLFFGGAVIVGLVFVLGVMTGRRVEARGHVDRAETPTASDPLAALDRLERSDDLSFRRALTGTAAPTDVDKAIGEIERRRTAPAARPDDRSRADKHDDKKAKKHDDSAPGETRTEKADARPDKITEKAEARPDKVPEKADARPDKVEARPEKAEARPEKAEARPDKAEARPDRDAKRAEAPGDRSVTRPDGRSEPRVEARADGKLETRDARSEGKSAARSEGKVDARTEGKPEAKTEARSEAKTQARSDGKTEPRADGRLEAKSESKASDGKVRFTLQLSSFQARSEAEAFLSATKAAGYPAYLVEAEVSGKGTFYRVRLGSYRSLEAANDAKAEYERAAKKTAQVMRL